MADPLKRGFKANAERRSLAIRRELGLGARERLDAEVLASHLNIPVIPVTELGREVRSPASIDRALSGRLKLSAVTICLRDSQLIVFNPQEPPGRRSNSLMHELSHVLLEHQVQPALGVGGCRYWDARQEAEADWQAATLLVPRDAALWWMRHGGNIERGAQHFGVSTALFRWRVNQTGVARQLNALRRRAASFEGSVRDGMREVSRNYNRHSVFAEKRATEAAGPGRVVKEITPAQRPRRSPCTAFKEKEREDEKERSGSTRSQAR